MPEDLPEYPPQFASSDLAGLLGQINDFAGVPPPPPPPPGVSAKSATAKASLTDKTLAQLSEEFAIPVSIVGSKAQRGPYLPGMKNLLIGVTFLRLSEQIVTPKHKAAAQKLAYDLIESGNAQVAETVANLRGGSRKSSA
jgi:U5 snRNP spliceosome subunit